VNQPVSAEEDSIMTTLRISLSGLCLSLLLAGCQPGDSSAQPAGTSQAAAMRVTPIRAEIKTLTRRTEQPGEIEAFETAPLLAKVTGYVRRVHVDIGDRVKGPVFDAGGMILEPGQLLVEIDVPELQEELKQKLAIVTQSEAAVKVAEAAKVSAEANVAEAQAMVDGAQALYLRWQAENERVKKLAESSAVTQKVADETEQQFRAADATRRETAAKIRSAQARLVESEAGIDKAKADLLVAQADAERTRTLLSYSQLRAPFDGIISARQIDTGHLVTASGANSKPLLTVVAADTVRLHADVPESDAALVQTGQAAKVKVAAVSSEPLTGTITRSTWVLHAGTRTLRVQIDLPNPEGRLRPGMSAQVDLLIAERPDVLTLPRSAVLTQDGQTFCLRIDADSRLVKHPVKTGLKAGADVEILEGLTGSEELIGTNLSAYREGQTVEKIAATAK
jgi:RND family efflux transporter MFP subunit